MCVSGAKRQDGKRHQENKLSHHYFTAFYLKKQWPIVSIQPIVLLHFLLLKEPAVSQRELPEEQQLEKLNAVPCT